VDSSIVLAFFSDEKQSKISSKGGDEPE